MATAVSTTITWSVDSMNCYPIEQGQTDVVFQVAWRCSVYLPSGGTSYSASAYGLVNVTYQSGSTFTPYSQLTESQVLGWVWSSGVDKTATEAALTVKVTEQASAPVVTPPLPWPNTPPV